MNNEPVAWAYILDGGDFMDAIHPEEHNREEGRYTTPLYTHPAKTLEPLGEKFEKVLNDNLWELMEESPAKTLTDEEIQAIAKESYVWNTGKQEWSEIEFARAILRKAQEKC